jgi:hypothetical protein
MPELPAFSLECSGLSRSLPVSSKALNFLARGFGTRHAPWRTGDRFMETRATVVNGHRRSRVLLAMLVIAGLASAEAVLGRLAVVEPERRLAEGLERMGAALLICA